MRLILIPFQKGLLWLSCTWFEQDPSVSFLSMLLFFNNIFSFVSKALCRLRGLGIHFLFSVYSEQIPSQVSFPVGQGELKGTSQQWRLGSGHQSGVD